MNFPDVMPNKEVINEDGSVSFEPMTQDEFIAAMPLYIYPVEQA
jgi:hypothetical protein